MGLGASKQRGDQLTAAIRRGDARSAEALFFKQLKQGTVSVYNAVVVANQSANQELLHLLLRLISTNSEPGEAHKLIDQRRGEEGATPLMLACELGDMTAAMLLITFGERPSFKHYLILTHTFSCFIMQVPT